MVGMALTVVQTTAAIAQAPQEDCAAAGMAPPAGEDGVALTIDSPSCSSGAPVIGCPNYQP